MDWFETIGEYFTAGLWSPEMVRAAVVKGKLTPEQYTEITGKEYAGS